MKCYKVLDIKLNNLKRNNLWEVIAIDLKQKMNL